MNPNKRFHRNKPTKESIDALFSMYEKNKSVKELVKTFDLDITMAKATTITTEPTNNKNNNTMHKKFKNANESEVKFDTVEFVDLEKNKELEGKFYGGFREIKNDDGKINKCFELEVEVKGNDLSEKTIEAAAEAKSETVTVLLPSNVQLVKKMENISKVCADRLTLGVEVCIVNEGLQKIEGVTNKTKVFKVLYV